MSIPVFFNNKEIVEPGVYAMTTSGEPVKPTNSPFGVPCIIDTGNFAGWGGGAGVSGELKSGADALYRFNRLTDFRGFVKGGEIWNISDYLFNPLDGVPGPSEVLLIRAATTTCAKFDKAFTNARLVFKAKNEGSVSNAIYDEKLATLGLSLNGVSLVVDNEFKFELSNNLGVVATLEYTVSSTSQIANLNEIAELIATLAPTFKTKLSGTYLLISAPEGSGADGNEYFFTAMAGNEVTLSSGSTFTDGEDGTKLLKGLAMQMRTGTFETDKYIFDFFQGTFKGKTDSGFYYGETDENNSVPILLCSSPEVTSFDQLVDWMKNSPEWQKSFFLDENETSIFPNGFNGLIVQTSPEFFELEGLTGGSQVYNPADLDLVLELMRENTNTFFICDKFGENAISVQNQKILTSVINESEFERFLIVGGGKDSTKFEIPEDNGSSRFIAAHYDSERVILVHSGAELEDAVNKKKEKWSSLVTAFNVAGRLAGLAPQEPITFKSLKLKNFNHVLTTNERTRALQSGVLHIRDVEGIGRVVNQGINTKQRNQVLWDSNGKSYEISIMSISSQLNKTIVFNLRPLFVGRNRSEVSPADVKTNVEATLLSQTSEDNVSRLITKFANVDVQRNGEAYNVTYGFSPNGPINKLFVTGFMLDNI